MSLWQRALTLIAAVVAFGSAVPTVATAATTSTSAPFSQITYVPCANGGLGESVLLSGMLHVVASSTVDAAGGIHGSLLFNPQGATGAGLVTGTVYRSTGETRYGFNARAPFPFESTYVNNFKIIGPGTGNNLLVHQTVQTTVNANGEVTATVLNNSVSCQ